MLEINNPTIILTVKRKGPITQNHPVRVVTVVANALGPAPTRVAFPKAVEPNRLFTEVMTVGRIDGSIENRTVTINKTTTIVIMLLEFSFILVKPL